VRLDMRGPLNGGARPLKLFVRRQKRMRIAILGNSGSGKSMLACWLAGRGGAPLLDLDTVAWESGKATVARPEDAAVSDVNAFCTRNGSWVLEGCYANLIRVALPYTPILVFLDLEEEQCISNCRARPWEPHKYTSKAAQDERLPFLLTWVRQYYVRDGEMSHSSHAAAYAGYLGPKYLLTRAPILDPPQTEILAWLK
jgi:adenylate kinase family enzyme